MTITHHPEYAGLLRAVLETPQEDTPRLILADWLEDQGEQERAEYIRDGVAHPNGRISHSRQAPRSRYVKHERLWMVSDHLPECCEHGTDHRGFLYRIELTLEQFEKHASSLFAAHPITAVTLTDREPISSITYPPEFFWYQGVVSNHHVPVCLSSHLLNGRLRHGNTRSTYYGSRALALSALSTACVTYGRQLVGLPALQEVAP